MTGGIAEGRELVAAEGRASQADVMLWEQKPGDGQDQGLFQKCF